MASGRAIVAGWNGAATEFVLEGVTGFLSAPGDVQSLATHIKYLWDQPDEAARMGFVNAACGPMVRSSYHADRQAKEAGAVG